MNAHTYVYIKKTCIEKFYGIVSCSYGGCQVQNLQGMLVSASVDVQVWRLPAWTPREELTLQLRSEGNLLAEFLSACSWDGGGEVE